VWEALTKETIRKSLWGLDRTRIDKIERRPSRYAYFDPIAREKDRTA